MSSWPSSDASGASVTLTAPEVQAGQTLYGSSSGYSVLEFIGEGCFGKVAKCQSLATRETVAVKILKKDTDFIQDTEKEVSMLEVIRVLDPDHTNVVKFFERFEHMGQTCLVFEMLDRSLYELLQEREWEPLSPSEIRPIAKQLLVALDALKGLSILHTDIKPDNIMFANKRDQPLRIKLIDFGEAIPASKVQPGMALQPTGYRAPEIALGLPFTEAIDVWGVGCVLAFLYLADNLFPVDCDYQMMKSMVEVLGQLEDHLLCAGKYTQYFFIEEEAVDSPTWRLMTPEEYTAASNVKPEERHSFIDLPSSLDDLVQIYPKGEAAEFEDRRAFVDLMKQLLHLDGDLRNSPHQALQHPFITKSHLTEHTDSRANLATSRIMMSICPVEESADRVNTPAACKPDQESAAGFNVRGLPSGSNDDVPAKRSSDGTKPTVPYDDDPTTGSSNGVPVTYSCDEDPAAWSSDGELSSLFCDEDPAAWSSDGELPSLSPNENSSAWLSDGELISLSCDEDSSAWSFDEISSLSSDEDSSAWSFDEISSLSCDEDPAIWFSDGAQAKTSYKDAPTPVSSDEAHLCLSCDEDPASWSSDGAKPPDFTAAISASSGRTKKLMKRIHRFFSRVTATFSCCCRPTVED